MAMSSISWGEIFYDVMQIVSFLLMYRSVSFET